jgi:hypothetical protein
MMSVSMGIVFVDMPSASRMPAVMQTLSSNRDIIELPHVVSLGCDSE